MVKCIPFHWRKKKDQIKTPRHCCDNIEIHTKPLHTFRKINNLR